MIRSTEVRSGIEQARKVFTQMKMQITKSDLSLELRTRMVRCFIYNWTLNLGLDSSPKPFEIYLYRKVLRIPWVQKVTKKKVVRRMGKQKEL